MRLKSKQHEIESSDAIEFCFRQNWSDGLPVVPPTEARVRAMLAGISLSPEQEITYIAPRKASIPAEKVAINAVMAGCKPAYMPVIVAALKAMGDPVWGFHGPATSTMGAAVFILVNGPLAHELNINCKEGLFGPGWRANMTIGRAVRLVMRNVTGTLPGKLDRSTFGHAGKLSFCIAENEAESPWPAVHVERGYRPDQSTVTVMAAVSPQQVLNEFAQSGEEVLRSLCQHMRISAATGFSSEYVLIFADEHRNILVRDKWTKEKIRHYCHENTRTTRAKLKRLNIIPGNVTLADEAEFVPLVPTPDDFMVVAAGGPVSGLSVFIPGWSSAAWSRSVTRPIEIF